MFGSWKKSAGVIGVIALLFGFPFVTPWLTSEQRTKLLVLEMIIVFECVLFFVLTRYIWNSFTTLFDYTSRETSRRRSHAFKTLRQLTLGSVFIALALGHYSLAANYFYHGEDTYYINFISFVCSGFFVQFFILHLCLSTFVRINKWLWINRIECFGRLDKMYLYRVIFITTTIITGLMTVYGVYHASQPPVVITVDIPIRGLPKSLNRFSVVVVSDIHLGPTVSGAKLESIVKIINDLNPDVVAVVGDLTDGSVEVIAKSAEPLRRIKTKHGKYFVSGNHEYYTGDVNNWFSHLQNQLGFVTLHNSHVNISNQLGDFFYLAGTDDIEGRRMQQGDHGMDLDKAVKSCDKQRPIILLAHQPRAAKLALSSGYNIQLVLSGHTHGGQMFPMVIIAYFANPFFAGLYEYGSGHVYVTQGAVYWGFPMRQFSDAEITRVFLHRSEGVLSN